MIYFLRFLRWAHGFELALIDYRINRLHESLASNLIDLDQYIVRRNDMSIERNAVQRDYDRWDRLLAVN